VWIILERRLEPGRVGRKEYEVCPIFFPDVSMFKIQELGGIFVSDEFKQVVERHDLVGLRFIPVIE
jgi:hypothetical protein